MKIKNMEAAREKPVAEKETVDWEKLKEGRWLYGNFIDGLKDGVWRETTHDEIRAMAEERFFSFEPLTPLTKEQEDLLRAYAAENLGEFANRDVLKWLTGEIMLANDPYVESPILFTPAAINRIEHDGWAEYKNLPKTRLSLAEKVNLVFDLGLSTQARIVNSNMNTYILSYGNRPISMYAYSEQEFDDRVRRAERPINVLDIGSGKGLALYDLKQHYGGKVITHGLAAEQELSMLPVDYQHYGLAERMPAEFKNKFDFIFSNMAFRYFAFQDIALRNAVKALRVGGKAEIHFRYDAGPEGKIYEDYFLRNVGKSDHMDAMKVLLGREFEKLEKMKRDGLLTFDVDSPTFYERDYREGVVSISKLKDFSYDQSQ